ncbi:MAG: hypothetical protein K0R05_3608 [Anaerocolumna sp.]|jgi:hypothetical protein|nr:hypothetical protein [Anaerocolumna sp.]
MHDNFNLKLNVHNPLVKNGKVQMHGKEYEYGFEETEYVRKI